MQMLRGMGVKVIEIPTDPETGISVEALELALEQWPIKGIILVPNCNNPLGFIMPDARKRAVLSLAQRHDIVIFEDDVYGELATEYPRPRTIHSRDIDGRVLLCSSFSKSIAPGLRVGWVAPGRYHDKLMHMKYATSSFNVPSTQNGGSNVCAGRSLSSSYPADAAELSAQYGALYLLDTGIFSLRNLYYAPERRIFTVDRIA